MVLYGHVIRVGDGVGAAQILAPEHRAADDPAVLAAECLAAVDASIAERAREGDILAAGADLGAGEGQEPAALALLAAGFAAALCASADAGFVAEARALGLPVITHPRAAELPDGALLRIDLAAGTIERRDTGESWDVAPAPPDLLATVRQTQLLAHMRRVVEDEEYDG